MNILIKGVKDLNINCKTIKLLDENTDKKSCQHWLGKHIQNTKGSKSEGKNENI